MRTIVFILTSFVSLLPAQEKTPYFPDIPGFKKTSIEEVYTPDNLFDLIDGAADMFLMYDFQDLHMAEYSNDSLRYIRVEAYRHKNPENAFGAYAQERSPHSHFLAIGGEGYLEEGALNFWKGSYYVKLVTNDRGIHVQRALETIATTVAHALPGTCQPLSQFDVFPPENRRPHAEYYVNRDFLSYSFFHTVFVVPYDVCTLFVMQFPSSTVAQAAITTYFSTVLKQPSPSCNTMITVTDPQEGSLLLQCVGNFLIGAKELLHEEAARALLSHLEEELKKNSVPSEP